MQVQCNKLDGLAKAHVIGKHAAEADFDHLAQPCNPASLIGAQGCD
jgi:hypothetical protein